MIFLPRHRLKGVAETLAWLAGRRQRVRIVGESMEPTLSAGHFVLVDPSRRPQVGELAVARHPDQADLLVVKRVAAWTDDDRAELASDNPSAGTDSRVWGPLPASAIVGTVTVVLDRPSTPLEARPEA